MDRVRSVASEAKQQQEEEEEGSAQTGSGEEGEQEEDGEEEEETLPADFIPGAPFEDAPYVRFVFSARLEPAPPNRNSNNNDKNKGGGGGGGASGGGRRLLPSKMWRRRRRRNDTARAATGTGRRRDPIVAEMETEWAPLTRIREEHAPMPAPETKCMQVCVGGRAWCCVLCAVGFSLFGHAGLNI